MTDHPPAVASPLLSGAFIHHIQLQPTQTYIHISKFERAKSACETLFDEVLGSAMDTFKIVIPGW